MNSVGTGPTATTVPRKLSLGCGHDVRPDWVNLDIAPLPGVNVVHNLEQMPWPFADCAFDLIECIDILEHLVDLPDAMREIHRILAPGGEIRIAGPHFTSYTVATDPTHRRAFAINTFEFFTERSWLDRGYYFNFSFETVRWRKIEFQKVWFQPWNWLMEPLVNSHRRVQTFYESTFFARLFPAHKIEVVLVR